MDNSPSSGAETGHVREFRHSLNHLFRGDRPNRQRAESTGSGTAGDAVEEEADEDNLAIYPLAIPLLAGPSAIMLVILVNTDFAGALANTLIGYSALLAVMVSTGIILCLTVIAEGWLNE